MLQKPDWARSLERWTAFWAGGLVDRPPVIAHITSSRELEVGSTFETAREASHETSNDALLEATIAHFDPARNHATLERQEEALFAHAELDDDTPPALTAGGGVYFTGAVYGAPVRVTADMMTAEHALDDWDRAATFRYRLDNVWVQRALGLARQLVVRSQGRYAVTGGLLEGPSDICAKLRGPTRLAADLYEHPEQVRRLAERGAEDWVTHTQALHKIIPLYDGGTATQWSLWTPGRGAALQEDFCTLISPRQYREFFLPLDRELARLADVTWMHIHAGQIHLVDEVLRADEIRGVQIVYDGVVSPPLSRTIPIMQRVQRSGKCLILRKYRPEDLREILPHLSPRRLAIDAYFITTDEARRWLRATERWASGDEDAL